MPETLHRYAFVKNNPINYVDHDGFNHEKLIQLQTVISDELLDIPIEFSQGYLSSDYFPSSTNLLDEFPIFTHPLAAKFQYLGTNSQFPMVLNSKAYVDETRKKIVDSNNGSKCKERDQMKCFLDGHRVLIASIGLGEGVLTPPFPLGGAGAAESAAGRAAVGGATKIGARSIPILGIIIGIFWPECAGCNEPIPKDTSSAQEQAVPNAQSVSKSQAPPISISTPATPEPPQQKKPCDKTRIQQIDVKIRQLEKGIKSELENIAIKQAKINSPWEYIDNFNDFIQYIFNPNYRAGLPQYWEKEIRGYERNIQKNQAQIDKLKLEKNNLLSQCS